MGKGARKKDCLGNCLISKSGYVSVKTVRDDGFFMVLFFFLRFDEFDIAKNKGDDETGGYYQEAKARVFTHEPADDRIYCRKGSAK